MSIDPPEKDVWIYFGWGEIFKVKIWVLRCKIDRDSVHMANTVYDVIKGTKHY